MLKNFWDYPYLLSKLVVSFLFAGRQSGHMDWRSMWRMKSWTLLQKKFRPNSALLDPGARSRKKCIKTVFSFLKKLKKFCCIYWFLSLLPLKLTLHEVQSESIMLCIDMSLLSHWIGILNELLHEMMLTD